MHSSICSWTSWFEKYGQSSLICLHLTGISFLERIEIADASIGEFVIP